MIRAVGFPDPTGAELFCFVRSGDGHRTVLLPRNAPWQTEARWPLSRPLMTRQARVVAIGPRGAHVTLIEGGGCNDCDAGSSCGVGLLGRVFRRSPSRFLISSHPELRVGDDVTLGLHPAALLLASLLGFGGPLLGMLLGGGLAAWLFSANADIPVLLGGGAGLVTGLFFVRRQLARSTNDPRFRPVLIGVNGNTGQDSVVGKDGRI